MADIIFPYNPTIVIGLVNQEFSDCGFNSGNILNIIKISTSGFQEYDPTLIASSISGFEKGEAYFIVAKTTLDLSGIAYNTVPDNYEVKPGINVFANKYFAGIALQTVDFATVGFNASNIRDIFKIALPYEAYDPNLSASPIDGFVQGQAYLGYALADMDISAYLAPPIVIPSDIDQDSPGADMFYGTNEDEKKGYYPNRVKFFPNIAALPATGTENIVYVAKAEGTSFYWDGADYVPIGGDSVDLSNYYTKAEADAQFLSEETDPTVPALVKAIPVSTDAATKKYLNWDGSAYVRKQIDYSEIGGTPPSGTSYTDAQAKAANPQSKTVTIGGPTATDTVTIFYTDVAITITKLNDQIQGTGGGLGVTYQINHAATRNSGSPNTLLSAARTINTTAGSFTTTFNDATIPAGSWVWYAASSTGGVPSEVSITLTYTID